MKSAVSGGVLEKLMGRMLQQNMISAESGGVLVDLMGRTVQQNM